MSNKVPAVSVIMSEYNTAPNYLRISIESILNQTFKDFELIIIDDCGVNNVQQLVNQYDDQRIRVVKNQKNEGLVFSLNSAVREARGKYLVRMDTDDVAMPNRVEVLYEFIQSHPEYSVVGSRVIEFSGILDNGTLGKSGEKTKESIARGDTLLHPSVIMQKKDIKVAGGYPNFERAEDLALWCELLMMGLRLYVMDDVLLRYRVDRDDYSKRKMSNRIGEIKARLFYYPKLNLGLVYYWIIIKSIISGLLPINVVRSYRRKFVLGKLPEMNKKLHVLHVIGNMDRGGAETFLMNVLRSCNRDKITFSFLCYGNERFDYEEELKVLGAEIFRVPDVKSVGILSHIRDIMRIIRENNVDVIHAHTYFNSVFSLFAARLTGIKLRIVHSHNTVSEQSPRFVKKVYFAVSKLGIAILANRFVACGEEAGHALFLPTIRFSVIHNGIDVAKFTYDRKAREEVRNKLKIRSDTTIVMHVGRFVVAKNHAFLIDIFFEYLKSNSTSLLLLIGDGPLLESIKQRVNDLGIQDNVMFAGKRSDMCRLYNAADVFVFPSLYEGLPVVLVETQANGLPVIASDNIDRQARLSKGLSFLSLDSSPTDWSAAMRQTLGLQTRRIPIELTNSPYNIENSIKKIECLYEVTP